MGLGETNHGGSSNAFPGSKGIDHFAHSSGTFDFEKSFVVLVPVRAMGVHVGFFQPQRNGAVCFRFLLVFFGRCFPKKATVAEGGGGWVLVLVLVLVVVMEKIMLSGYGYSEK